MSPRDWQRLTAAFVLLLFVGWIGLRLRRDRPRAHERVTLGSLLDSLAEGRPAVRAIWARLQPVRSRLAAVAPEGLADAGVAFGLGVVTLSMWIAADVLEDVATNESIVDYDTRLGDALGLWQFPWVVRAAEWISEATSPGGTSLVAVGVVGVLFWLGRRVEAFGLFAAVAGAGLWTTLVKELLGRERPGGDALYDPLGHSFPSGHTSGTAALYVFLAWLLTRHAPAGSRAFAYVLAGSFTALVASCRLYLAVHWMSDVLGGAALGVGWAAMCILWTRLTLDRQERRVDAGVAETD